MAVSGLIGARPRGVNLDEEEVRKMNEWKEATRVFFGIGLTWCLLAAVVLFPAVPAFAQFDEIGSEARTGEGDGEDDPPEVPEGYMLIEGDIAVPENFYEEMLDDRGCYHPQLWPCGIVPYRFGPLVSEDNRAAMRAAMAEWEAVTDVDFIPRTDQANFVTIKNSLGNWSMVGMVGGEQEIGIWNWNYKFIMVHELGHTLGLWHEQSRDDRDTYVQIIWDNIVDAKEHNFDIQCVDTMYGAYDFDSVMHYGQCAFHLPIICVGCPGSPICDYGGRTIVMQPGYEAWQELIGQRDHLSTLDIETINYLYPPCQVEGACCDPSGDCTITTADDCAAAGSTFLGPDTSCEPNPCNHPPVAQCKPTTKIADGACCVTVTVTDIDDGSYDPDGAEDVFSICITAIDGNPTTDCPQSVEVCDWPLTHEVTLTITDQADASASCTAQVSIEDTTPPAIKCDITNTTQPAEVDGNCEATIEFAATVTDNCCLELDGVQAQMDVTDNATLSTPNISKKPGVHSKTVLVDGSAVVSDLISCPANVAIAVDAQDCSKNAAKQCNDGVNVVDLLPPDLTCPPDITLARGDMICNSDVEDWLNSATATDNCDSNVVITHDAPECGFPYSSTTEITWTATDDCENSSECSAEITIKSPARADMTTKGSLLVFPKIELRWDENGNLIQDTFIDITNDYPGWVGVQMYFINGDQPLEETPTERYHFGHNWVNNQIVLTSNHPTYWNASEGDPHGVSPFTILDPSMNQLMQGRPALDGTNDRVLRGMILAWAVNSTGSEIRWNHLKGDAVIVNYDRTAAWEYSAWAFGSRCVGNGQQPYDCIDFVDGVCCDAVVIPGQIDLDAFQYDAAFSQLVLDFYASGSEEQFDYLPGIAALDTDLTLVAMDIDIRQETLGPVTTKAKFDIWNMNETKFSNTERCITGWDQQLVSRYNAPNHFMRQYLQTDKGRARINGIASTVVCGAYSVNTPLLGLSMKLITFAGKSNEIAMAGNNLFGAGTESATIRFDIEEAPPELWLPEEQTGSTPEVGDLEGGAEMPRASGVR